MFDTIKNAGIAFIKPLRELYTKFTPQAIQDTVEGISSSFGKLFGQVKQFGANVLDTGVKAVAAFDALQKVNSVVETAKAGLSTTKNAVIDLMKGIVNLPNTLFGFVTSFFKSAENADTNVAPKASTVVSDIPKTVINDVSKSRTVANENANQPENVAESTAPRVRRGRFAAL